GRSGSSPRTTLVASIGSVYGSEPTPLAVPGPQGSSTSTEHTLRLVSPRPRRYACQEQHRLARGRRPPAPGASGRGAGDGRRTDHAAPVVQDDSLPGRDAEGGLLQLDGEHVAVDPGPGRQRLRVGPDLRVAG